MTALRWVVDAIVVLNAIYLDGASDTAGNTERKKPDKKSFQTKNLQL